MKTNTTYPTIPQTGFLRIPQSLALIPLSASTWWAGVASGKFPKPIKLGHRTTVWRAEDIRTLIDDLAQGDEAQSRLRKSE